MNEPAERLRNMFRVKDYDRFSPLLVAALAAERKATVERIRVALAADSFYGPYMTPRERLYAILDAEARS